MKLPVKALASEVSREVVRRIQREQGCCGRDGIVRLRANAEGQRSRHSSCHVVDRRQRENGTVVVDREVENRVGHLLISVGIRAERATGYECGIAVAARTAEIIDRWSCSPGTGIAGQTTVKGFWAYA